MNFQISRNGQVYGPYTLDDLKRYLATGNILLTDLAKSEEMPDWLPVSQVLAQNGTPTPAQPAAEPFQPIAATFTPAYTAPQPAFNAALASSPYSDPPTLHWALVMLFTILTLGAFMVVWNLIVSSWLRRVQPNANAFYFYIVHAVLLLLLFITPGHTHHLFFPGIHIGHNSSNSLLWTVLWLSKLIARFSERASLEEHFNGPEPLGLTLSPVMTFFFGGLYFQYHLTRIALIKQTARFPQAY